jgi:sulfatase maturation enzyme AslB (radical SAM superfamily)
VAITAKNNEFDFSINPVVIPINNRIHHQLNCKQFYLHAIQVNLFTCELFVIVTIYRYCNYYSNRDIAHKINSVVLAFLLLTQRNLLHIQEDVKN